MKNIITIVFLILPTLVFAKLDEKEWENRFKSKLPMTVNSEIEMNSASIENKIVSFSIKMKKEKGKYKPKNEAKAGAEKSTQNSFCSDPTMKEFRDNNYDVSYKYYTADGYFIYELNAFSNKCK